MEGTVGWGDVFVQDLGSPFGRCLQEGVSGRKAQHGLLGSGKARWFSVLGACYLGISPPQTLSLLTICLNVPQSVRESAPRCSIVAPLEEEVA